MKLTETNRFAGIITDPTLLRMTAKAYTMADYGTKLANGSFTGFAGLLQRGEVDVVAADLTITAKVQQFIHF